MPNRVQIGPKVEENLWQRFRQDVEARKGQVRGSLGDELENALREYLKTGPTDQEKQMLEKLSRIEQGIGVAPTDGGGDTATDALHTHAPSRVAVAEQEKPAANAATEKKVAYLAERVLDREVPQSREITNVPESVLVDVVKEEYGFRKDTAMRYVERLISHFDLVGHPSAAGVLVPADERDALMEEA